MSFPVVAVIGRGGWSKFRTVFPGGDGIIYAITRGGNLLFYRDNTRNGMGDVHDPGIIGRGDWEIFMTVFCDL